MARRQFNALATISDEAVAILDYQPAESSTLAQSLVGLQQQIEAAAAENVISAITNEGQSVSDYTETEMEAMVTVESLKLTGGLELTAVLLRAKYLRLIQSRNMVANHPGGYTSLQEMAEDNGISTAELSQTLDLVNVVFPYVQNVLGISPAQLWETVGKSKLRELVPVLKVIITGENSDTRSAQASADAILDGTAATLLASAQGERYQVLNALRAARDEDERRAVLRENDLSEEGADQLQQEFAETVQQMAVDRLITDGMNLPVRRLRNILRPERTDNIEATVIPMPNGQRLVTTIVDNDQYLLLQRRLGTYMEEQVFELPDDPRMRQIEAARIREIRALQRLLGE